MQRVSSLLPSWDRTRSSTGTTSSHGRKNSVDKVRGWADKFPSSVHRLSTSSRVGREAYWPTTLDKECEKAARILMSFCSDGFSTPDDRPGTPQTNSSQQSANAIKVLKKIPPRIIQNAVGLAVFTSMRSGLWTSGSGGSGILIARKTDGTWSPPSGLMLQTASLGFVIGVDIYDCVLVINNFTVLETFARSQLTLGSDVSMTAGPLVPLGLLENDITWAADLSDTAITYVKAKGQCSEVRMDGTVLHERADENERFYGMKLGVAKILAGDINQSMPQTRLLTEVLKAAEGRVDYDMGLVESLSSQPAPGDALIESPKTPHTTVVSPIFGIPEVTDPDPFGVLALEMAGIGIREAGSRLRPESSQFEYHPSPTSPMFPKVSRQSVDTYASRSNRGSYISSRTAATENQMTDAGTQTSTGTPNTTPSHSQSQSEDGNPQQSSDEVTALAKELDEVDYTKIDISALRALSNFPDLDDEPTMTELTTKHLLAKTKTIEESQKSPVSSRDHERGDDVDADDENEDDTFSSASADEDAEDDDDGEFDEEEPVICEVATAQPPARMAMVASQVVHAKGAVVNIPKRVPPPLPLRSPARSSRRRSQMPDVSKMIGSPLRQEFDVVETPKPENAIVKTLESETLPKPENEVDVIDVSTTEEKEMFVEEKVQTHTTISMHLDQHSSRFEHGYFPKVDRVCPPEEGALASKSLNTDEQVDLQPGPSVAVSVA
ncbi:hypothetical protein F5Y15DRAFT_20638 [Xylariaceae sp. FL0016]|nr:hypothetical protein F5Y15DRAFT_20638 [Xylariaceae sp. FL0016]